MIVQHLVYVPTGARSTYFVHDETGMIGTVKRLGDRTWFARRHPGRASQQGGFASRAEAGEWVGRSACLSEQS